MRNFECVYLDYIDPAVLPPFLVLVLLISVAPGPDMALIVAVGLGSGRAAAARAALGVTTGVACYVGAVATGLGQVAARAPAVLFGVRVAGIGYLLWLAFTSFRDLRTAHQIENRSTGGA